MHQIANRVTTERLETAALPCDEASPLGCPMLTYLAVVLGFAASFALLGMLS